MILKGIIIFQPQNNKFCFFLPDCYDSAGCLWEDMPVLEIEKMYKDIDLSKNSLWIELKCKLKFINLDTETGDTLEEWGEKVGTSDYSKVPSNKIEDAKMIRLYIGDKWKFQDTNGQKSRLKLKP